MTDQHASQREWLGRIHAEYKEMPGLNLTRAQVRRLWNLDAALCDALLDALERRRILRRTAGDRYVLAHGEGQPAPVPSS